MRDIINEKDIKIKFNKIYNLNENIKKEDENKNKEIKNKEINEKQKDMIKKNEEKVKYRNEINLIYETDVKIKKTIFGWRFVDNNKNNLELIINGNKSKLIREYELEKGENKIKLIIKNNLTDVGEMFDGCESLYNIDELKYLNVSKCTNFKDMFY